ncbi:hypothetical protein L596_017765 [Steinernema carpocapsae]|uniref:C-type lectin domain-containing protein n=1 Tax=Steinernema carpocapsae TaxID=34508 RepID=A0A4V6A1T8_STECR|nr:hypothetical protein L596_017765 [Steinernema carpocapsae]
MRTLIILGLALLSQAENMVHYRILSAKTIQGIPVGDTIEASTLEECGNTWLELLEAIAITFNSKTRECSGFSQIYGFKIEASTDVYVVLDNSTDVSEVGKRQLLNDISKLLSSYLKKAYFSLISLSSSIFWDVYDKANLYKACNDNFNYSQAASIHSKEEEEFICVLRISSLIRLLTCLATLESGSLAGYLGFKLGLSLSHPDNYASLSAWTWTDGSPMDYWNFRSAWMCGNCATMRCTHGGLYWRPERNLKGRNSWLSL